MNRRLRILVSGVVQGIGFRPFVYRLTHELGLTGFVRNDGRGVSIEVQGNDLEVESFLKRLHTDLPPSGVIDRCTSEPMSIVTRERSFVIIPSSPSTEPSVSLAPDRYVCPDCLNELRDPLDRRYGYPFINCTHCGPRHTIVAALPYDRATTTMAFFEMCDECQREYSDPLDRRYHAQPIACPDCGPHTWLASGSDDEGREPVVLTHEGSMRALARVGTRLAGGDIIAIKGIGGFHLAADARNGATVSRLRGIKQRLVKPFAVMVRDLETAHSLAFLDAKAEELLTSPAAPIVLTPVRAEHGLAESVAPGLTDIGLMLPYSPIHHLLFDKSPTALVMTSGNPPSEPITTDNREALKNLEADGYLLHNRKILVACDDSVIRTGSRARFVRRSRGYVPTTIKAGHLPRRQVLALGAMLKVTVSTLCRGELVVGRHLGDLDNIRSEAAFSAEVMRMLRFGSVEPEAIAVDLHPDLASTLFAEEVTETGNGPPGPPVPATPRHPGLSGVRLIRVQHHHAHLAAVLLEHELLPGTEVVGIIIDGFGFGPDGTIWGGEILRGSYTKVERVAHLRCLPQPGGDRAALETTRMSTSLLLDAGLSDRSLPGFDPRYAEICPIRSVSPLTSSAGRLIDGVAAILGIAPERQGYEAEAALRLEAASDPDCDDAYPLPLVDSELDTRALVTALVDDNASLSIRAARFHNGLADGLAEAALDQGVETIAIGGGCALNRLLIDRLTSRLLANKVRVLLPNLLPPGDGGLSAGQAAVAACALEEENLQCV